MAIDPAPVGVDPNNSVCGECDGRFKMPRMRTQLDSLGYNENVYALVCSNDPAHNTHKSKNLGRTKHLGVGHGKTVEVDVVTQKPTTELAHYEDEAGALAVVNQANSIGLFPQKATEEQALVLAQVALAYGLDPIMGEIMPYQGRPYITIAGRRRLDAAAGRQVSTSFRPPTEAEESYLLRKGGIAEDDVIYYCVLTDVITGASAEGFGRVKASEGGGNANLPTEQRKPEMAQKRAERRAREILFGPAHKPLELQGVDVLEEGDEAKTVEGSYREVPQATPASPSAPPASPSAPPASTEPEVCPVHNLVWVEAGKGGGRMPMHIVEGELGPRGGKVWCKQPEVVADITNRFVAQAAKWSEEEKQDWRDRWSGMSLAERHHAIGSLEGADPATGEIPDDGQGGYADEPVEEVQEDKDDIDDSVTPE